MAKKDSAAVAVAEPDDDIEELDDIDDTAEASEEAAPKAKKAKKAKAAKPERTGMSTKEAAEQLGITPVRLRRILRSEDGGFADGNYTRYDLSQETIDQVKALIESGKAEQATKKAAKKSSKKADASDTAAEEVGEDLDDLEGTDATEDLDLEDDDEEDDE